MNSTHVRLKIGLAAFTGGCATGTKFSEYRTSAPPVPEGYGRIWFYRPSAIGAAVQPEVKLDDQVVGRAVPHGFFYREIQPGEHQISPPPNGPTRSPSP